MTRAERLCESYGLMVRSLRREAAESQHRRHTECEPEPLARIQRCQATKTAQLARARAAGVLEEG